jgi:hypothetical protein
VSEGLGGSQWNTFHKQRGKEPAGAVERVRGERAEYGPPEDGCNELEDQLGNQEYEVFRLEHNFRKNSNLATLPLSQATSLPTVLHTSADDHPLRSHDGRPVQFNSSRTGSPSIPSEPDIELNDMSVRGEEPPPPDEELGHSRTEPTMEGGRRSVLSPPLGGIALFLAPVIIVSGMTASHGDNWKLAFVG